jgi:hypothetical protein
VRAIGYQQYVSRGTGNYTSRNNRLSETVYYVEA